MIETEWEIERIDLKDKKIGQLREQVNKRDVAIEKLHAEILNLRDENSTLSKARAELDAVSENQKYQLSQYAKEIERMEEVIKALKVLAKPFIEA